MSTKFKVVHRVTGKPYPLKLNEYFVMYDSGYPALVTNDYYHYINSIDMKEWKIVFKRNFINKIEVE